MKAQVKIQEKILSKGNPSNHQNDQDKAYPGVSNTIKQVPTYQSMIFEVAKIAQPVGFEAIKSFYHLDFGKNNSESLNEKV